MPGFILQTSQLYFQFHLSPSLLTDPNKNRAGTTPFYLLLW